MPAAEAQDQEDKHQEMQTTLDKAQLVRLPRRLSWKQRADQHWLAQMFQLAAEMEAEAAGVNNVQTATKSPL